MSINPVTWPLAGKIVGIVAAAAVGAGGAVAIKAATGSPEPGVSSYLCPFNGEKELLQWKTSGSHIGGTFQDARLTGNAPDEQVIAGSGSLTGTVSGSGITLNLELTGTWYGTIRGSSVVLNVPQPDGTIAAVTCSASDVGLWNTAVKAIDAQATSDNNAAEQRAAEEQQQKQEQEQEQEQEQQDQQDEQQAQSDLSTLGDFSLSSDLGQLADDVQTVGTDLANEKTDAAQGQDGPGTYPGSCYNLDENVSYDAEYKVEYDASYTFGYDLHENLQDDISSGRQDISAVQSDISTLEADGVSVPPGTQEAIAAVQSSISKAISTANSEIAQVNSDVSVAYAIPNNMATGNCQGDGPGAPPSPIQDIS